MLFTNIVFKSVTCLLKILFTDSMIEPKLLIFFFLIYLFILAGLVLYFKKTFINFQYQNSYTIVFFFFSQLVPKEDHTKGENILSQLSCKMHP